MVGLNSRAVPADSPGRRAEGQKCRSDEQYCGSRSAAFGEVGGNGPATGGLDDVGAGDDGRHPWPFSTSECSAM